MQATRTPLQAWFQCAYLVATQTFGVSALQLQRQLGLARYETAFQMLHKLRAVMVRPNQDPVGAHWPVEVDETLLGARHQTRVAGAIEVCIRPQRGNDTSPLRFVYVGRLRLRIVSSGNADADALIGFVQQNVVRGAVVRTNGWPGNDELNKLGYGHDPAVQGSDEKQSAELLPRINVAFSSLKSWLTQTHRGVSAQHLPAYLDEFVFRFNRRFYPMTNFASVLGIDANWIGPKYPPAQSHGVSSNPARSG